MSFTMNATIRGERSQADNTADHRLKMDFPAQYELSRSGKINSKHSSGGCDKIALGTPCTADVRVRQHHPVISKTPLYSVPWDWGLCVHFCH
jgi:hypothetical protein